MTTEVGMVTIDTRYPGDDTYNYVYHRLRRGGYLVTTGYNVYGREVISRID